MAKEDFCYCSLISPMLDALMSHDSSCAGLGLTGCQITLQPLSHFSTSSDKGKECEEKACEIKIKIKTGRSLSNYHHEQNRLILGKTNLIYCQLE